MSAAQRQMGRGLVVLLVAAALWVALQWGTKVRPKPGHGEGRDCATCHPAEAALWAPSHHAAATAPVDLSASAERFDGAPVTLAGLVATPLRDAQGLAFEIADLSGARRLRVTHTLAVEPLQQYLLEGDGGRLLVAPIAWDIAGERWIDPSVEGASGDPSDPLYWAGITGTWNHMCAECHTTGLEEGYDPQRQRYQTRWTALGVTCQACHGADASVDVAARQIDVCGQCHTRLEPVARSAGPGIPLLDHALPALLDGGVYTATGAIRAEEEAFEVGSFLQSRMYAEGVRCTDCHDPHSGGLRASGNALCTRCHEAATYDGPAHHRHGPDSGATGCVTCHMPTQTYMKLDVRHDHRLQIPRPATADRYGDPNACRACHTGAPPQGWWPGGADAFAEAVEGARRADPTVLNLLMAALSRADLRPFQRASAARLLAFYPGVNDSGPVELAARDEDALVRAAAIQTLGAWGIGADEVLRALEDPLRAVRFTALRAVFGRPGAQAARQAALAESVSLAPHPDSPATWTNLAVLRSDAGDLAGAERDLRTALAVEPRFEPARQNLAALLMQQGRRSEAEQVWGARP